MPAASNMGKGLVHRSPATALMLLLALTTVFLCGCRHQPPLNSAQEQSEVRLGYFPNVTHAQAVVGVARGDFQNAIGPDVKLTAQTFNAGPAAIEAIYAGHIDICYVGPSPAINGFIQSKGEEVRVIAGAAKNGVTVVGNRKRCITKLEQLKGGRIATPQYANTQDIAARYFLSRVYGFKFTMDGGDTDIIPISNPDIETLFVKDQIDGAWVPEPWGTRLIEKGLANEIVKEKDLWPEGSFAITTVIARREFVEKFPGLTERFLRAHVALTGELQADAQQFVPLINSELKRITGKALDEKILRGAIANTEFTSDPSAQSFVRSFEMARDVGILHEKTFDVQKLLFTAPLDAALAEKSTTTTVSTHTTESTTLGSI